MTSNMTKDLLVFGKSCILMRGNEKYKFIFPTVKDSMEIVDFKTFLSFCSVSIEDINKQTGGSFTSKFDLFSGLFNYQKGNVLVDCFINNFLVFADNSGYNNDATWLLWNGKILDEELFNIFCDCVIVSCGLKELEEVNISEKELDEWELKIRENEQKIKATKRKDGVASKRSMSDILLSVKHEFHSSNEELYNMSIYGIYYMYAKVGLLMNYDIEKIAAGNGLLPKKTQLKYWSEK